MSLEETGVLLIGLPTTIVDDDTILVADADATMEENASVTDGLALDTVSDETALEKLVISGATEAA
jgi:hypothetical protein